MFEGLFFKAVFCLLKEGNFDFGFLFDYVVICYEVSVLIEEKARAEPAGA